MDKKGFNASSGTLNDFIETYVHYRECKGHMTTMKNAACKDPHEKVEKSKFCKHHGYCKHSTEGCNYTMACHKGCMRHEQEEEMCDSKKVCFQCNVKYKAKLHGLSFKEFKDLNILVDANIANIIVCFKQKDLAAMNKLEALSIFFWSSNNSQSSKSK
eukprot:15339733-Ditylum_brightwellii.AAC.1